MKVTRSPREMEQGGVDTVGALLSTVNCNIFGKTVEWINDSFHDSDMGCLQCKKGVYARWRHHCTRLIAAGELREWGEHGLNWGDKRGRGKGEFNGEGVDEAAPCFPCSCSLNVCSMDSQCLFLFANTFALCIPVPPVLLLLTTFPVVCPFPFPIFPHIQSFPRTKP